MINHFKHTLVSTTTWFVILVSSAAAAGDSVLDMLHGALLDSCDANSFCLKDARESCKELYRKAFRTCDALYYQDPESNKFTNCLGPLIEPEKSKILAGIDRSKCSRGEQTDVYESEASNPIDNPLILEYFTFNSMDVRSPKLYSSPESACKAGADRIKKLNDAKGLSILTLTIDKVSKSETYGPDPAGDFLHLFSTPVYIAGECFGRTQVRVLKSNGVHRKGEILYNKFRDQIFVAVQCDKAPRHQRCEFYPDD